MPQFLVPWKVSAHRLAAIALYRALLSQCTRSGLAPRQQQQIANVIRNRFKENRLNHSKKQLRVLFKAGYSAIDNLDGAVAGDESSRQYLAELLAKAPIQAKRPPYIAPLPAKTTTDKTFPKRSILDRPLPLNELTGKRHIPRLVSAGGIPMLRIKKPQPHHLSAYLRRRVMKKQKRVELLTQLGLEAQLAEQEDEWDDLIASENGLPVDGPLWTDAIEEGNAVVEAALSRDRMKDITMATKMLQIVDEERELARVEREERLSRREGGSEEGQI